MFEWKPEYSVQIPEVDSQHQRLFELAAKLHSAMAAGQGKAILEPALARLINYTKVHFAAEEKLMRQYQYPETDAHKAQHDRLTAQVLELQERCHRGEKALSVSVMTFLKDWLQQHIAGSDQKYSVHIRRKLAA